MGLVFVGRFVEKKGVDDLIEALATIVDPRPRSLLIGDGPLDASMRDRAAALGLDATFVGLQPAAVVARRLAESKVLVAPSRTAANGESEGLPTTILEAASHGVPAVSTLHSGIPEAVEDGKTGLLGPEGDRAALAEQHPAAAGRRRAAGPARPRRRAGGRSSGFDSVNADPGAGGPLRRGGAGPAFVVLSLRSGWTDAWLSVTRR